jgi:phosphotriesterase-related protein
VVLGLPGWQNSPEAGELLAPEHVERLVRGLQEFRSLGGHTVVDAGGALLGRDPVLFAQLAQASGVRILASTGFWEADTFTPHYRLARGRVLEDYARLMHDDILLGMACEDQTRFPAGASLIVAATSLGGMSGVEELVCRAAGYVAKLTGVPVLLPHAGRAPRQLEILRAQAVPPDRLVVGHCDDARWLDPARDEALAREGLFVAFDHVGWQAGHPSALPDTERARAIKTLVERGLTRQVLLACSSRGRAIGFAEAPVPTSHLLRDFVPLLRREGISEDQIETMLVDNPARVLGARPVSGSAAVGVEATPPARLGRS